MVMAVVVMYVLVSKIAAIALKLTGLDDRRARFQALSALTGTGFTTEEAESVINHPTRRKIITILMVVGNAGIVAAIGGVVSSFLNITSIFSPIRFAILGVFLYLVYRLATSVRLVQAFSQKMEDILRKKLKIHKRRIEELLFLREGYGIAEVILDKESENVNKTLAQAPLTKKKILVLSIERKGGILPTPRGNQKLRRGDVLLC